MSSLIVQNKKVSSYEDEKIETRDVSVRLVKSCSYCGGFFMHIIIVWSGGISKFASQEQYKQKITKVLSKMCNVNFSRLNEFICWKTNPGPMSHEINALKFITGFGF